MSRARQTGDNGWVENGSPPGISNIVEDLTPTLGGNLSLNGKGFIGDSWFQDTVSSTTTVQINSGDSGSPYTGFATLWFGGNDFHSTYAGLGYGESAQEFSLFTIAGAIVIDATASYDITLTANSIILGGDLDVNGKDIVGLSATTSLNDTSGNELISFTPVGAATCGIVIENNSNQAAGQGPKITIQSGATDTGLKIEQKGAGYLTLGNNQAGAYIIVRDEITFRKPMQFLQVSSATNAYNGYMKIYSDNASPPQMWSRDDTGVVTLLSAPSIAEITDITLGSPLVANDMLSFDGIDWTSSSNLVINGIATFDAEFDNGNSGASDTIDWNESNKQKSTISASTTLTFTDPPGPASLTLRCIQNASYTLTLPAAIKWPSGTAPTLTTGAASIDILSFYFDGTTYYGLASQDFS